jgi:hypothetical protein
VLWRHAAPNAAVPLLAVLALDVGRAGVGALITETVFARPGMGKLIYDAVMGNDSNLALLALLVVSLGTMLATLGRRPASALARPAAGLMRLGLGLLAVLALPRWRRPLAADGSGHDPALPDLFNRFAAPSRTTRSARTSWGATCCCGCCWARGCRSPSGWRRRWRPWCLGTAAGLIAAWRGGWLDAALMRLADGLLALPALPLLVILAALGPGAIGLPRGEPFADILRIAACWRCSAGSAWRGWCGRPRCRCWRATSCAPRAPWACRNGASCGATSCRSWPRRSPSPPRWPSAGRCWPKARCPSWGWASRRRQPPGATCSPTRRSWCSRRRWPPSGRGSPFLLTVLACNLVADGVRRPRGG